MNAHAIAGGDLRHRPPTGAAVPATRPNLPVGTSPDCGPGAFPGSVLRASVMALPVAERLDYALELIDELTGQRPASVDALIAQFRLTRREAQVLSALDAAFPRIVTREQLFVAIWSHDGVVEDKIVDVYISKLRGKIGSGSIITEWGQGWRLAERVAA